jgi:hypothetical protein
MLEKGQVELVVAGCPEAVLAAARVDYEAHTGSVATDHHVLAYMRGLLGDRSGNPGETPLVADLLMKALRAEVEKRLGREPSMDQIYFVLRGILTDRDEAGTARSAARSLQSVPAEVVEALPQLAHSTRKAPAAHDLLQLG